MYKVICPACQQEMEIGYIKVYKTALAWTPEGKKKHPLFTDKRSLRDYEVQIGEPDFWNTSNVTAFLCRNCEFVMIKDIHLKK